MANAMLRSFVILAGAITLLWGYQSRSAHNFPSTLENIRFNENGPGGVFSDEFDDQPTIGALRQFENTKVFEDLLWTLHFSFGLAVLVAGIYEIKALSIYGGVWMLLFSLGQIAVVSSFAVVACPEDINDIDPEDPNCAISADGVEISGFYAWYIAYVVFTVLFYIPCGALTIYFGTQCPDDNGRK